MRRRTFVVFVLGVLLAAASLAKPSPPRLSIISFNVLAPLWAAPVWYPESMDPALLDREYRRERLTAFLSSQAASTDVFCLQEVAASEFGYLRQAVGGGFAAFMAENDPAFWSNWLVPELPWEPNGTAIFVKGSVVGSRVFEDLALGTGNHAALLHGVHTASGRTLRVASLHLDSDRNDNRLQELRATLDARPEGPVTDILCGDFNEDTVVGSASGLLARGGYVDVLASLGTREATHPWSTSYYASPRWAIIDHIAVRNAKPVAGDVVDFGVWTIVDEVTRIEENFRRSGSDHFPVKGTVALP